MPLYNYNSFGKTVGYRTLENVQPIWHYDWTRRPNISPLNLEFSSSRLSKSTKVAYVEKFWAIVEQYYSLNS